MALILTVLTATSGEHTLPVRGGALAEGRCLFTLSGVPSNSSQEDGACLRLTGRSTPGEGQKERGRE